MKEYMLGSYKVCPVCKENHYISVLNDYGYLVDGNYFCSYKCMMKWCDKRRYVKRKPLKMFDKTKLKMYYNCRWKMNSPP